MKPSIALDGSKTYQLSTDDIDFSSFDTEHTNPTYPLQLIGKSHYTSEPVTCRWTIKGSPVNPAEGEQQFAYIWTRTFVGRKPD